MNIQDKTTDWAVAKFGVGQPVRRTEDPVLVQGQGRYTDDLDLPHQAYAVFVRSRNGHGTIKRIDTAAAKAMPGVLGVYTGADLAAYGTLKCAVPFKNRDGSEMKKPPRPSLPTDKVRFVGDPVAVVVAETLAQAKDAAEAVEVDIDVLPAVTRASEAAAPGAPQLYDDVPGNVALDYLYGDPAKVAEAFAKAAHVTKVHLVNSRVVVNAMEPRAAIASFDKASGRYTMNIGCQGAFGMKGQLVDILGVPGDKVHVLTGNVGGSFGMKAAVYPEYVPILHAAKEIGRPVKWTADRFESFLSDHHGRDHEFAGELALDAKGKILAVRFTGYGNTGAYLGPVSPLMSTLNIVKNAVSVYKTPADRGLDQGRVHQHDAGLGLSRRRAPRGQLLHGAADRPRRGRDGHRPAGAAPPQPDQAGRYSLQGLVGHAIRQRGLSGRVRARGRDRRHQGLQAAKARGEEARQAARALGSAATSKSPRRRTRRWAASASSRMATSRSSPARSTTARATRRRSRRC